MKRFLAILSILFLTAFPLAANAAIALDSADAALTAPGLTANITLTHTSTGSNLIGFICAEANSVNDTVAATWNGATVTLLQSAVFSNGGNGTTYLFEIVGQSTGLQTLHVTDSQTKLFRAWSVSFTGAAQTGQPDNSLTANGIGTSNTNTITTHADKSWTILCQANNGGTPVAGAGSNSLLSAGGAGFGAFDNSTQPITPAGNYSMNWNSIPSVGWGDAEASFAPFVAAATVSPAFPSFYGWW